jgi:hypothetical protein
MDATNALSASHAVIASRLAEARQDARERVAQQPRQRVRIPLIQVLSPIGRLTPRSA